MAYDGWLEFNGTEIVNLSRTAQLAQTLGIETVWTTPSEVQWIQDELGGVDYHFVDSAPWFDPDVPASGEFAGVVPLGFPGLDDSTRQASTSEYLTDGGRSGKARNSTLSVVGSVALVGKTDRGVDYGKRWLDRVLRESGAQTFCAGSDLRYFPYVKAPLSEVRHRRDVRLTRGQSVTRKRVAQCSSTWLTTFTLTADDPYEYGEEIRVLSGLGSANALLLAGGQENRAMNPRALTSPYPNHEWSARYSWTRGFLTGVAGPEGISSIVRFTCPADQTSVTGRGFDINHNMDTPPPTSGAALSTPVVPGEYAFVGVWVRSSMAWQTRVQIRFHDGAGNWLALLSNGPVTTLTIGEWAFVSHSVQVPASSGAAYLVAGLRNTATQTFPAGTTIDATGLMLVSQAEPFTSTPQALIQGSTVLVDEGCPVYDYSPVYDPLYPALLPAPAPPSFYPNGWFSTEGLTFDRYWARIDPVEPSLLNFVPVVTLSTSTEARMVRFSIWPDSAGTSELCDPLYSVVASYIPPDLDLTIDGEQKAAFVWDGFSPVVRRADTLVYSADAKPVEWTAFNDPGGLLITIDIFSESEFDGGGGEVRASLAFVPKSD